MSGVFLFYGLMNIRNNVIMSWNDDKNLISMPFVKKPGRGVKYV